MLTKSVHKALHKAAQSFCQSFVQSFVQICSSFVRGFVRGALCVHKASFVQTFVRASCLLRGATIISQQTGGHPWPHRHLCIRCWYFKVRAIGRSEALCKLCAYLCAADLRGALCVQPPNLHKACTKPLCSFVRNFIWWNFFKLQYSIYIHLYIAGDCDWEHYPGTFGAHGGKLAPRQLPGHP